MKRIMCGCGLVLAMAVFTGCELEDTKVGDLRFENASKRTVQVIPRTTEWGGFSLAPGEKKKLRDIDNPDYDWEPKSRIDVGVSSTTRNVVFVEREKELQQEPIYIIQQQ